MGQRGDVPVRSCPASSLPVENLEEKFTGKVFPFQIWQNYKGKDSAPGASPKSQTQQRENVREKSYLVYNDYLH